MSGLDTPEYAALYQDFLETTGHVLATYTTATGIIAPPDDLMQQWLDAITDDSKPTNASALPLIIKYGGETASFDPQFLADLGIGILDYEAARGGADFWEDRWNQTGGMQGILDPANFDRNGDTDLVSGRLTDPLESILSAMDNTPEAAAIFFDTDDTVGYYDNESEHEYGINSRLAYLTDRPWDNWYQDHGDAFGDALVAATTHHRDPLGAGGGFTGSESEQAAILASQAVFLFSHRVQDNGWNMPDGMSDSVGEMLANYIADVWAGSQYGDPHTTTLPDGTKIDSWLVDRTYGVGGIPVGMAVQGDDLRTVYGQMGQTPNDLGIKYVTAATIGLFQAKVNAALDGYDSNGAAPNTINQLRTTAFADELENISSQFGRTLGPIIDSSYRGGMADEQITQDERQAQANTIRTIGAFIPSSKNPMISGMTDVAIEMIAQSYEDEPNSVATQTALNSEQSIRAAVDQMLYTSFWQAGYFSDSAVELPTGVLMDSGNGVMIINPEAWNEDSTVIGDDVREQFNRWLEQNPIGNYTDDPITSYKNSIGGF